MNTICDKTGIVFETDSKRQKNHPAISSLLNEAAKNKSNPRAYSVALEACGEIKNQGIQSINEALDYIRQRVDGHTAAHVQRMNEQRRTERELEQKRREAKERRQAQNAFLREHGYHWSKDYADFDEYEEGEPSVWNLYSPDNRVVTVAEAMNEIERGMDVVLAERKAAAEAAEQRQAERQATEEADRQAHETAKAEVKALGHKVEAFDYSNFKAIYDKRTYQTLTMIDTVYRGQISGVDCGVIYRYTGGHDYSEYISYYCADPEAAGLKELEKPAPGSMEETFARLFGE